MRFLIFLTVFYFVAAVVMSAPVPSDDQLIGGGVPHPKSNEGMRLTHGNEGSIDSRPIWDGGKDVKPWLKQKPVVSDPSKSANK